MAEKVHFEIGHFRNFDGPMTLTFISDDLESHIVENDLSTSTNTISRLVATLSLIADGRTYVRTYGRTDRWRDIFSLKEKTNAGNVLREIETSSSCNQDLCCCPILILDKTLVCVVSRLGFWNNPVGKCPMSIKNFQIIGTV